MTRLKQLGLGLLALAVLMGQTAPGWAAGFSIAKIYIEYNQSANDLGFHVSVDGEDWRSLRIVNPSGVTVFQVEGKAGYQQLGMTELFFEGAEPSLDDFPLTDLLALFPVGKYKLIGTTVSGGRLMSTATLSHAVPEGPMVAAVVDDDIVTITWDAVNSAPPGFPQSRVQVVGYQVIVETFQVTLPASSREITLPAAFVESLAAGEHQFEVLAIEVSGNQTITEGYFRTD